MQLGIIGAGYIAKAHISAIHALKLDLVGVYDINHEQAQKVCKFSNCHAFTDTLSLIQKVDGVIIASPNHAHKEQSMLALKYGKHVLCEKPMSSSLEDALVMNETAQQQKSVASIGFNYRYLPITRVLKSMIVAGELGDFLSVSLAFKKSSALTRKNFTWRDDFQARKTSGALGDLGVHLLDLLFFLFDSDLEKHSLKTKICTYVSEKEQKKVHVDDHALLHGRLENGIYFDILSSKAAMPHEVGFSIKIIGTKKEFFYESNEPENYYIKESFEWVNKTLHYQRILSESPKEVYGWADTFISQLKDWHKTCTGESSDCIIANFSDGLKIQHLLDYLLLELSEAA